MTTIPDRQLCELDARDFLTDEVWKQWKTKYDEAMAYRKTLKGKPTEEQREQLTANAEWIDFCDRTLWHSSKMSTHNRCTCKTCAEKKLANARARA
jgi:hypothetical protein